MKLIAHIGGHFGTNYRLELIGDKIAYWEFKEGGGIDFDPETIRPSAAQWDRFWKFMQQCSDWAERYEEPGTMDGTSWLVEIEKDEISIWSSGSNDYPQNFQIFLKEVRRLLGGREFR